MKRIRKIYVYGFVVLPSLFLCVELHAQDISKGYIENTAPFSRLYSGKIESPYNTARYKGYPYHGNQYFVDGSVVFNDILYTGQKIRLDLYKQQIIVWNPVANQAVTLPSGKVQKLNIHQHTFLWIDPSKDCGLKNKGFYLSYFEGENINLLGEERFYIFNKDATPQVFENKVRYYLGIQGKYHNIKNKKDILRLFPQHKKQINQYAKANRLDFTGEKIQSMVMLAAFCDKL